MNYIFYYSSMPSVQRYTETIYRFKIQNIILIHVLINLMLLCHVVMKKLSNEQQLMYLFYAFEKRQTMFNE